MALPRFGQQFSFADLRTELGIAADQPMSLDNAVVRDRLGRGANDASAVNLQNLENIPSYRPPASLQFNSARTQYLQRTAPSGCNANRYTINVWVKQLAFASNNYFMAAYNAAGNYDNIGFLLNGGIQAYAYVASVFRWRLDTVQTWPLNQWHNVHLTADISNAAISDRVRLWVNGERQTAFTTNTQPTVNNNGYMNNPGQTQYIGIYGSTPYADMRVADHILLDDVILGPEWFGEYIGGLWAPKRFDITKITRGPNSHHLNFAAVSADNDTVNPLINLSNGARAAAATDWRALGGTWVMTQDRAFDRPRFGGQA